MSRGVRDPVDRISPSIRSRTTAYPRLRSPVSAARVVCGSHPVASVKFEDGRAIGPLQQIDDPRQLAAVSRGARVLACSPTSSGPARMVFVQCGCSCSASLGSIASSDPSSTAMAFNPAAVNLSA